ncbi:AraC family transcriptional regulator [Caproicibacter fermentans]|uniref:AraC family transcriptional regulator n=1 Tax=Caproicibacter fermentans TaxID=2576756 RepID=A0A7G8TDW0_9FIRM|nr:AraC family transcriptional regulator [Caproicibacter fermentans]QNK41801.1 AraC family transcriptional regulator [Caproicibacter fermentans]
MKNLNTYWLREMPDSDFCVDIFKKNHVKRGENIWLHWHEHLQFYYFVKGEALLECGHNRFEVSPGSIVVINSNELHYLESLSNDLEFDVIRIDPTFLFSNQVDLLQTKYLAPLASNRISFRNLIENDTGVLECVTKILQEYYSKKVGYELAVKASIYQLIVLLLRGYVCKILSEKEFEEKTRSLKHFNTVLQFIEDNYDKKIRLKELADSANLSACHFCRTFKQITGKTLTNYVNEIRLEKAACFLKQTDLNITETALKCGFDSISYFNRLFSRHYKISPTKFRKANMQ